MSNRRAHSLQAHMMESPKPARGRCVTAICFSWKIITCIVSHVTLVLLVVSYCVGGAYLFQHLERPHEMEVKKGIHYMRLNLTEKIWRLSDNVSVLNENDWMGDVKKDLAGFEKQILTAMKSDGWDGDEDITKSQWTFAGSLFYSIIVITTIGYGHISPRTDWGKVTTIFYAIIGIPLMLLCLSNIGDVMATSFRFIYWRVCCYICTRTSKRSRYRGRQRSIRGHRLTVRSQPPPYRRSIKTPSIHRPSYGVTSANLAHAYSDPELHRLGERDFEYVRSNKRFHSSHGHGHGYGHGHNRDRDRNRDRGRHHHQHYGNDNTFVDEEPSYTQTLNRSTRYSNRHRHRERVSARHTVEREQYFRRSKQQFDSMENIEDISRSAKRSMSVRSVRSPRASRTSKFATEPQEMNHLVSSHPHDVGFIIVPPTSSARTRAKSVDHRLSMLTFYDVDEESVRKTPIITNRYAIGGVDYKSRQRTLRSQSMPRSAFDKSNYNHSIHQQNSVNHKQTGLGRQNSMDAAALNIHYGNRLELPTYPDSAQRIDKNRSPRRHLQNYDDHCFSECVNDFDYSPTSNIVSANHRRSFKPKKDRLERLPPSPRIMSPMGFTVNRQVRRRYSYDDNDGDSCYGDGGYSDYYGEISAKDRPVPIWLCVFLVISYILGGAALFAYWEEWSFLDSAYFCFITLTTIGFGDFVPAKGVKDESEQSIAYCSLYLLFGIALLAMSFNLVQEEFIANVKEVARRLGILKDEDDEDD